ncbi:hypothetical protein EV139_2380 [Leucobacter luti]|uniref:Fibronectin type-III domain-containing protein n=1 Tax=Leucobacter luti TaxID=340320 RepID=A0A4Q7TRU4_9MICO|nr:hypothetical protein [Leucobacter luti]RZT62680.1 hypothetical protein EV139_2380 [Leucobacter luti]
MLAGGAIAGLVLSSATMSSGGAHALEVPRAVAVSAAPAPGEQQPRAVAGAADPGATATPAGVTSVPVTAGKARGSGLWGYAGDVQTRTSGSVFSYGLSLSPADGALWVTDSAKIIWTSNSLACSLAGGKVVGSFCYVGQSRVLKYGLTTEPDWALGEYRGNGGYGSPATRANAGVGANYTPRADALVLDGTTLPGGRLNGVRGIAATDSGGAWAIDADFAEGALGGQGLAARVLTGDGSEGPSFGKTTWPSGSSWTNRHHPEAFDYPVGIARLGSGNLVATSSTPELLKEYREDGSFVRNILLTQPAGSAGAGDKGYRSPYAVAADPSTPENDVLVGYTDPGADNPSFIERVNLDVCTTEEATTPVGSFRDRCEVLDRIGVGTLGIGSGPGVNTSDAVTFAIQVDPSSGDIYVGQRQGAVRVFATDGSPLGGFPGYGVGTQNGMLQNVRGIGFDARGLLYATTSEGASATRVQIFGRTPDAVTGLAARYSDASMTEVELSWDAPSVAEAAGQLPTRDFVIEMSTDGGAQWNLIDRPLSLDTTAAITGLNPETVPVFRVAAWNEAGNGDAARVRPELPPSTLVIEQLGNGLQAADPAEPARFPAKTDVEFRYVVTNEGPAPVTGIEVSDSVLGEITEVVAPEGFVGDLAPGEAVTLVASGGALPAGAYEAETIATGTSQGEPVSARTQWFGFGAVLAATVAKTGNGLLAPTEENPARVSADSEVAFAYRVTNTGNVAVGITGVADSELGAVDTVVSPEQFSGRLEPGATAVYTAAGTVGAGSYRNDVTVTYAEADPGSSGAPDAEELTATASWFGEGIASDLSLRTTGNGVAAPLAEEPVWLRVDAEVAFAHLITNGGTADLTIDAVTDSVLGELALPADFGGVLEPGGSVVVSATAAQLEGARVTEVTVTAHDELDRALEASDRWHGFGVAGGISLEMTGDGVVAERAESPRDVVASATTSFGYTVTNDSNAPVTLTGVTSFEVGSGTAPSGFTGVLGVGESVEFSGEAPAPAGAWAATGSAVGLDAAGLAVEAHHEWHGFGVAAQLQLVQLGAGVAAPSEAEAVPVAAGSEVSFRYVLHNSGNTTVALDEIADTVPGEIQAPDDYSGVVEPGATVEFTAVGPVALGSYVAEVSASGVETRLRSPVAASASWHGIGVAVPGPTPPGPTTNEGTGVPLAATGGEAAQALWGGAGALLALVGGALLASRLPRRTPGAE